jgi:2-oxoglutarate decarboxylase
VAAEIVEIQMPQMGESVTEGTVLEWRVAEGQEVAEGDTVVEISTDKIDAEVPSPANGVITKILAQPDDTVEVGQVLAQLDPNGTPSGNGASADGAGKAPEPGPGLTEGATGEGDADIGEDSVEADAPTPGEEEPSGESIVVAMPEMGESVTEGTVLEWHVEEGQQIAEGDTVIEISTDKIDAEIPAPAAGTITKLLVQPDDVVKVGQPLAEMTTGAAPSGDGSPKASAGAAAPAAAAGVAEEAAGVGDAGSAHATPVAKRIAAKNGVNLGAIKGSGPGGKVTKADVLAAADG